MRIILRILLFPVAPALTILILICRFLCGFSSVILSIISFVILVLALGTLILLRDSPGALTAAVTSFVISPYRIPLFAEWLIDRLEDLNYAIKSIKQIKR